jgi:hypothetical protein
MNLAPNGKPSNLTPEQYELVRTPKFKAWFGDWENDAENSSKVVDENGEPMVVYHGTNDNITEFMPYSIDYYYENGEKKQEKIFKGNKTLNEFKDISDKKGWRFVEPNFWFSKNNAYSNTKIQYQCFLKIINLKEQIDNISSIITEKESDLKNFGIKVIWSDDNEQYYCVFNSNQIKLADGSNNTFDSNNPDIRYEIGGIFQGTPHEFDKYSTDYMGTGEGQQVFGWGLYFTDIKDIAKQYAKNELLIEKEIAKKSNDSAHLWIYSNVPSQVKDKLAYLKNELNDLEEKQSQYTKLDLADKIKTYRDLIDIIENYKGKVYSVTLFKGENESDYDLLLWDSPVNVEQLEKIFIEAEKIGGIPLKEGWYFSETKYGITPELLAEGYSNVNLFDERSSVVKGDRLYSHLAKELGSDKEASLFLLRAGIDGIKYKSGTLSGMEDKEGYNYVIFDDDDVTIENKELYKNGGLTMKKPKAELLAPNGKPSNLAPEQYHLVRTPAFKAWFGDWENSPETASKILDDNGEPLVCYHGSNNEFNVFEEKYLGSSNDMGFYGQGFYFTFQKDEKWMKFAIGEASYYGKIVKPYFIKALNPFIFGGLKKYKGISINFLGTQSLVFLNNIAKKFPQLAEKITLNKTIYNSFNKENEIIQVPISILPDLIDKYSEDLKIIEVEDRGEIKINGYLKSKTKEVFYDSTESGGKKGSYLDFDALSYEIDGNNKKESIEILLIEAALEKYEGIEVRYNPEGYMTRFPEITDAIKENHDCIMQGETGDELVVFKPTQIKLSDGTNTTFDSNNPDIRYAKGGEVEFEDNRWEFNLGDCGLYAIALHRVYGFPIYVCKGYFLEEDWGGKREMEGEVSHAVVKLPNGNYLDHDGELTEKQLLKNTYYGSNNKEAKKNEKIEPVTEKQAKLLFRCGLDESRCPDMVKEKEIQEVVKYIMKKKFNKKYKNLEEGGELNPDIRYAQGGGLDNDVKVKIIEDDSLAEKVYDIVKDDLSVAVPRLALIENGKVIGGIYLEPAHSYVLDGKRTIEPLSEYKFDIYIKRSKRKKGYSKILLDAMIKDFVDNFSDADQIRGEVINNKLEKSLIKNYGFHCDSGNQEEITYCYLSREDAIDYLKRGKFSNGGNTKTLLEIINTDGEPNIINDIIDIGGFDEVLSIEQVENKLGRKVNSWNDDIVYLSGIKYKKVYLRPEYKKVIE